jgi:hypothetical protein
MADFFVLVDICYKIGRLKKYSLHQIINGGAMNGSGQGGAVSPAADHEVGQLAKWVCGICREENVACNNSLFLEEVNTNIKFDICDSCRLSVSRPIIIREVIDQNAHLLDIVSEEVIEKKVEYVLDQQASFH